MLFKFVIFGSETLTKSEDINIKFHIIE